MSIAPGSDDPQAFALAPGLPTGKPVWLETSGLADIQKVIVAGDPLGDPPDSPGDRVDPNTTGSLYAGVGSLWVDAPGPGGYIGSASAISPTHVLTAAHMLDLDDNGTIDVAPSAVEFNLNFGGDLSHVIAASALFVHPDWTGFNNPSVNDDVAVIELSSALPDGVPIYPLNKEAFIFVETATLVGYGKSGDGVSGYYVDASFEVKRTGGNLADFYDVDDEGSGAREIFRYDFDGGGWDFGGNPGLGNDVETTLGGGDSGGPAFVDHGSGLEIFGINTFTFSFGRNPRWYPRAPYFGSGGGGIVVAPYVDWIDSVMGGAGVTITESGGSTDVTEGGATDTYTIVLDSEPTADVTITVDPDEQIDLGGGSGAPIELTFPATDWETPQTVTVTAVDDTLVEGDHTGTITHAASSDDINYNGILIDDVTADITDNDEGEVVTVTGVDPTSGSPGDRLTVHVYGSNFEDGATADFGERVTVQEVSFIAPGQLDVRIKIHPRAAPGARDVTVTNPDGSSGVLDDGFTVTVGSRSRGASKAALVREPISMDAVVRELAWFHAFEQARTNKGPSKDRDRLQEAVDYLLAYQV